MTPDDWHTDLNALAAGIIEGHRDPFHLVTPAEFVAAVARLHGRIGHISDGDLLVGLDALVAMIGDGHTFIETDGCYRRFPLDVFWYGDQLGVVRALTSDARVPGARLLAIDGTGVDEIERRLQSLIPTGENAWYVRARSAVRITRADVLAAVGCLTDSASGRFTFARADEAPFTAEFASLPPGATPTWPAPAPDAPLRLQHPDEPLAYTALPEAEAAYANFRSYRDIEQTAARLIAHLHETSPARLVLDLRDNHGGDYTLAREHLIYPIWKMAGINRPGGLYVLIGRSTFSAAMVTATDFRRETEAVLVGEPTGARPVGYQELGAFDLPRSGLRAHCATRRYRFADSDVPAVFPDHHLDPDWKSERRGRDATLDWCLARPPDGRVVDSGGFGVGAGGGASAVDRQDDAVDEARVFGQ